MANQPVYSETTYGEKTSFDQFLEWEELPVTRNFVVGDIRKMEVSPWRRRGGLGCYIIIGHPKDPPNAAAYICEIPPGQSLQPAEADVRGDDLRLERTRRNERLARQWQKANF